MRIPIRAQQQCGTLVFDLESIGESQIDIGQWSAKLLARHQLAGEEVTNTDIGD